MKKIGINTIANLISRFWSMVSVYIFIPLYIKILGETTYGLVAFFATLQMTMNLLGVGLSNTLRREFAVGDQSEGIQNRKYKLLRSVENIYFLLAIVIVVICSAGADFISNQWLNIESLDSKMVSKVLILMGISIAIQFIANIYVGCLFGLDHQILANVCNVVWSVFKSCGALAMIYFVAPNLVIFYSWHIFSDILYFVVLRFLISRLLDSQQCERWRIRDFANLKAIWKYAIGILTISCISLVNRQLDKIIISRFLSITELGAYNIATTLGSLCAILPSAVYTAVFPKFTKKTTANDSSLIRDYNTINRLVNIIISCTASFIAVYAGPLIRVWTGSETYVKTLGITATLVVLAVAVIEFQEIPYALALAHGNTRLNVYMGAGFVPIVAISTVIGISRYGLLGAGGVYLVMMIAQTVVYLFLVNKFYCKQKLSVIYLKNLFLPFILSLIVAFCSYVFLERIVSNYMIISCFAVVFGIITISIELFIFDNTIMQTMLKILKRKRS